jgi:LysM repeat protein
LGLAGSLIVTGMCGLTLVAGAALVYGSGNVLPGVSAVGVDLGGMSESEAAAALTASWTANGVLLRDGDRTWTASPAELGITLDAAATAKAATEWGRSSGGVSDAWRGLTGGVTVDPVLNVDLAQLSAYLESSRGQIDLPATNAGVELVNGQAVASPASEGRALDLTATVDRMRVGAAQDLTDGALDLVMVPAYPAITDATPLVAQANALLSVPFAVNAYDPIRDEWHHWSAAPEVWAAWLTAASLPGSPTGLALSMNTDGPTAFLQANGSFADERHIELDQAVNAMQTALAQNQTSATIRVWHNPTTYTVSAGQTLAVIAEEVGIPYPYIQAANPTINSDALVVGQTLELPSKDMLVPLDLVPSKRIVLSRSQQHLWAYENGQVVFDWVISTGLPDSPTALGTFQVQSHEVNAYAEQWNLYMPNFVGFYHPGPNMELWNGFHGFPTRGGGYLLWTGDLGHPVTYGCVLLSLENAEALFNWAEDGVVVEVRA